MEGDPCSMFALSMLRSPFPPSPIPLRCSQQFILIDNSGGKAELKAQRVVQCKGQGAEPYMPSWWWVLLMDMGTRKTSLVLRFVKDQFYDNQEPTIGAAFFTQILSLNEATIKFDIWDTAGLEHYHSLAPMYYCGATAAVVVYDIANMDSFV